LAKATVDRVVAAVGGDYVVGVSGKCNGIAATAGAEIDKILDICYKCSVRNVDRTAKIVNR
jgi:hypothetical protein